MMTRREFLELAAAMTIAPSLAQGEGKPAASIPRRKLGRTGELVSIIGIGGAHLGRPSAEEAIRIVRTALDAGANFLDNCWDYNGGESEVRMGRALQGGYREKAFLMTKIDGRTRAAAARQIDESLRRLRTDRIDLLQFHEIIRATDAPRIFARGGALEAVSAAREAGKIRFVGFTGHKSPDLHLEMLRMASANGLRLDAVQMPLNVMDAHYQSFEQRVLPVLLKEEIGVIGMKPLGDGHVLESDAVTAAECLRYAMSLPVSVAITGCDSLRVLDQALDAARAFRPYAEAEITALLTRTEQAAQGGVYEQYKTTQHYDGTTHNPQWLG